MESDLVYNIHNSWQYHVNVAVLKDEFKGKTDAQRDEFLLSNVVPQLEKNLKIDLAQR